LEKVWISPQTDVVHFELDEIYWFTGTKQDSETKITNSITVCRLMTTVSREPRQILDFRVSHNLESNAVQEMIDSLPEVKNYHTDGGAIYLGVDFIGKHRRNTQNKQDTHIIEGTNANIRCYIAGLQRKSRCFFRKFETLKAVLTLFINAYNKFGEEKLNYRKRFPNRISPKGYISYPFSHLDFL